MGRGAVGALITPATEPRLTAEHQGPGRLRLVGELDMLSADVARGAIREEVSRLEVGRDLVLDLHGLRFTDSTGIHVFLRTATELPSGSSLVLRSPPRAVRRVLDLTGIASTPRIRLD